MWLVSLLDRPYKGTWNLSNSGPEISVCFKCKVQTTAVKQSIVCIYSVKEQWGGHYCSFLLNKVHQCFQAWPFVVYVWILNSVWEYIFFFSSLVFVPLACGTCSDLTCSWVWVGSKQIILSSLECVLPVGGWMVALKGNGDCVEGREKCVWERVKIRLSWS